MSFRIEITAASLEELADKALALGARLTDRRTARPASPVMPEIAQQAAPVEEAPLPQDAAPEPEPAAPALDYKKEVAPLVLRLVEVRGKPAAQKLLDEYGAAKASDIDPALWPEFVDRINAELA